MRVSDVVRFSPLRENGPVTVTKLPSPVTVDNIVKVINNEPGLSSSQIARTLVPDRGQTGERLVSARIYQMMKVKKPRIRRKVMDGLYRYYPINYKFVGDVPTEKTEPTMKAADAPRAEPPLNNLEVLVRDYYWESDGDKEELVKFLTWYKEKIK